MSKKLVYFRAHGKDNLQRNSTSLHKPLDYFLAFESKLYDDLVCSLRAIPFYIIFCFPQKHLALV